MRLFLFRHAKSDWGDADLADFDRPLNGRGKSAARVMGRYLREQNLLPNRILCSTSLRTRETLSRILPFQPQEAQIHLLSDIYDESDLSYTNVIRRHGGRAQQLMVIGHNPATEQTAIELAGTGDADAMADLRVKFPTGALAVIDFDIASWDEVQIGTGHLERFIKPRDLAAKLDD
ncbi:SixA phosphatase family protein [Roseibium alexandrii]|jgi:phosphohistidine phosphatase|uniref:Phosphohistidine phosphatase SixA n=1 Tax=Roseibium alexandrii (strain DSM 17067 / NCIMB 14079 / DFL-11) TaxID=244592 RepID=A0A5E8GUQ9_ROSAD|nr:histidine phosphatase family protein [Roseibium alexandrii]EEE42954.2 Phosphohistidine phosphatase SixA [Roseibium alexandrii DFL-11]